MGMDANQASSRLALTPEQIASFVVTAAVHAPSVHNTQPWWFSHDEEHVSVYADRRRQLRVADPGGREMMISCGAALFTARLALRALGYVPRVSVLPDWAPAAGRPDHLGRAHFSRPSTRRACSLR